jgi:hypothetical protein
MTCATIDRPMILFLGLTTTDLVSGAVVFMAVVKLWDSNWALPSSIMAAFGTVFVNRWIREKLPPHFFQHLGWSLGFVRPKGLPSFFMKCRFVIFGP